MPRIGARPVALRGPLHHPRDGKQPLVLWSFRMRHLTTRRVAPLLALVLAPATAWAQGSCSADFTVLDIPNALDGAVLDSLWWDRDGSGPLAAEFVIAGEFRRIGGRVVNGIARRDAALGW